MASQVSQTTSINWQVSQNTEEVNCFLEETNQRVQIIAQNLITTIGLLNEKLSELVVRSDEEKDAKATRQIDHDTFNKLGIECAQLIINTRATRATCKNILKIPETTKTLKLQQTLEIFNDSYEKFLSHSWKGLFQRYKEQNPNNSSLVASVNLLAQRFIRYATKDNAIENETLRIFQEHNAQLSTEDSEDDVSTIDGELACFSESSRSPSHSFESSKSSACLELRKNSLTPELTVARNSASNSSIADQIPHD